MTDVQSIHTSDPAPDLSHLWQPYQLRNLTIKNRIVDPAKTLLYGEDHIMSDRHIAFYTERAKGGVGVQVAEQTAAHPIAKGSFYQGITAYEKKAIPKYATLADAVHEHDCRFFVQLFHPGVHDKGSTIMDEWHELWAASRVPSNVHHEVPMVMRQEHIDDLVSGFGRSARNLEVAGIDGVEIHASHSYGIAQFMSPYYNKRDDRYGVGTKAGTQLALDIGDEVRRSTGDDFVMGIRMNWDEFLGEAGIEPELAAEQLEILVSSGLFDYFNMTGSAYPTLYLGTASMRVPHGYMRDFGKAAKDIVGDRAAVWIVGRIKDLRMANDIVGSGDADAVCMSRAQLADPFLVKKGMEGRMDEVNSCIGYNECIGRLFEQREVVCALNPRSGRERQWGEGTLNVIEPPARKKVAVIGGGPAGMKTAAVAASRGHEVTLYERSHELGGHINLLKRLPSREEWDDAIDNLRRAMQHAGVDVRLGTEASAASVKADGADAVVWATGSVWDHTGFSPSDPSRDTMPGHEQDNVITVGEAVARALEDPKSLGQRVVISEETGTYLPLGLAELLGQNRVEVEIVSPNLFIGEVALKRFELQHLMPLLKKLGAKLINQQAIDRIEGTTITAKDIWSQETREIRDVDTLVLSHMRVPAEAGLEEARDTFEGELVLVGDVRAPRAMSEIMFEGEKVGRAL
jgi:2,4-dienoyl-CoA reductase-like NADH-dependent reductase (Old Yellow Enzyme family)